MCRSAGRSPMAGGLMDCMGLDSPNASATGLVVVASCWLWTVEPSGAGGETGLGERDGGAGRDGTAGCGLAAGMLGVAGEGVVVERIVIGDTDGAGRRRPGRGGARLSGRGGRVPGTELGATSVWGVPVSPLFSSGE